MIPIAMWLGTRDDQNRNFGVSLPDFEDSRRESRTFSGMSLISFSPVNFSADDRASDRYDGVSARSNSNRIPSSTSRTRRIS
jgi:hypothetical protein